MEYKITTGAGEAPQRPPFDPRASQEFAWLQSKDITPSPRTAGATVAFPEAARSEASLNVQAHLHAGDEAAREVLAAAQPLDRTIQPPTFRELSRLSHEAMPDQESYEAGQYINVIHDLFKRKDFKRAVGLEEDGNHDEGLRRIFLPEYTEQRRQILPLFEDPHYFSPRQRQLIEQVGTARFSLAHFMHSQASVAQIRQLADLEPAALKLLVTHGIHDIGGALGHQNVESSLTLDEPTATRMLDAAFALLGTAQEFGYDPAETITPDTRQHIYLGRRAGRLQIPIPEDVDTNMFVWGEFLSRMTVANLLKCDTAEEFAPLEAAYNQLPPSLRFAWSGNQFMAFLREPQEMDHEFGGLGYTPAFLRSLKGNTIEEMRVILGYFAQALTHAIAIPTTELTNTTDPDINVMPLPYSVDFYDLALWCAANRQALGQTLAITYARSGNTLIPKPLDTTTYRGDTVYYLRHPNAHEYPYAPGPI